MVEAFALSLKWHEGIALSKERSRRRFGSLHVHKMLLHPSLFRVRCYAPVSIARLSSCSLFLSIFQYVLPLSVSYSPPGRLELLDQWVDGADRTVCVEPAPKYNASASLADRRNFNPSVSALATAHHDDDENAYKAAESNASETKGGYANGEDPNQKKTSADGGRRSSAVQSSKERQAESRKRKAQKLHALKQGATCVTATVSFFSFVSWFIPNIKWEEHILFKFLIKVLIGAFCLRCAECETAYIGTLYLSPSIISISLSLSLFLQRPPTTMTKSWSASEAPVARIKALELAEGPQAGLSLGVYLERLFSQVVYLVCATSIYCVCVHTHL